MARTPDLVPPGRGWQIDEARRQVAIASFDVDSLRGSEALTRIADFAAQLCQAPVALVTLVEEHEQSFLARSGTELTGTSRSDSFCTHTMWENDVVVIPDLALDPRFVDNPLLFEPGLRFYAGVPLVADDGIPLGTLCVLDMVPREGLTALQVAGLRVLAESVMARLRDSRDAHAWRASENEARRAALDSETRFRVLADSMPQMVWSTLPDGYHDYYNARWYAFTGAPPGTTDGEGWNDMFHPDDQARAWATWRHSLETGAPYEIDYRLRHFDGTYRWVLGRALPMRDGDGAITRWFGTCTDIHEQKLASEEREVISQELSHRIKNIFSVIAGLIQFAARTHPHVAPVAHDLRQRIMALGRAHDFVRPHSPNSRPHARQDSLRGLLAELFAPYQSAPGERLHVEGADVAIDDRAATPLALLFHELATNATKYGALSTLEGRVAISIAHGDDTITLCWREQGGPPVSEPKGKSGFGTQLVEMSAVRQLGGTLDRRWHPDGLELTIVTPAAAFSRASAS